jgi:anion-transporting  ArsA/GET3 family ATPase
MRGRHGAPADSLSFYDPGMNGSSELRTALAGRRVIVTVGAGGVGKTTTSAAIALGLAISGRKVAVLTIDPARRLATALGLDHLSGEPHLVDTSAQGIEVHGQLWAMMHDSKATFDSIIEKLSPDEATRGEILANPVYRELSTAVAGSNELSAVARLYELYAEHDFDTIVLDTPPSRNALDFLETPGRLLSFLEGRALQVFLAPGGLTARLFGRGTALVFAIFARVTGVDMLSELSVFFRSLSGILDGFGERTRAVQQLLRSEQTGYVIVTSPEPEPVREARFLAEQLRRSGVDGEQAMIVNRVHLDGLGGRERDAVEAELAQGALAPDLARRMASNLADFDVLVRRDERTVAELSEMLGGREPTLVGHLDEEVQDLLGLARIAELLGI